MNRQPGQSLVRLIAACLLSLLATGGAAFADPIRFPQDSDVAFFIQLASGWQFQPGDPKNANLAPADSSSNIALTILEDPDQAKLVKDDPQTFARAQLDSVHAQPISGHDVGVFSGLRGDVFYSRMTNPSGTVVNLKVILLSVARRYVVMVVTIALTDLTDRQRRSLDAALQGIVVGRPLGAD